MPAVRLSGVVTDDHELTIKVPDEVPPGRVELVIEVLESDSSAPSNPAREAARMKLAAAGLLSTAHRLPPGTHIPTDAEVAHAGKLPPGAKSSEILISEDRDEA